MRKFVKIDIIMTDEEGYFTLKGMLPESSIIWVRVINQDTYIRLKSDIDLDFLEKNFNSLYRTLRL